MVPATSTATNLATMVAGAVTEAGLWQSAVLMTDLKTAYLVHASPRVMFFAQLLGSAIGCFVGSGIYRLFTAVYAIPGPEFPIPLAYMWANTARLASGGDLPRGVMAFAIGGFFVSAALRALSLAGGQNQRWKAWVPSGIAISVGTYNASTHHGVPIFRVSVVLTIVGMYVPPSITLAKLVGAGVRLYSMERGGVSDITLMAAATGCILGEGTLGFVPAAMANMGVPRFR